MIIKCPECNSDLSDKAKTCPHCGYPMLGSKCVESAIKALNKTKKCVGNNRDSLLSFGQHLKKALVLTLTVLLLTIFYGLIIFIGSVDISVRVLTNIFLPLFWVPILILITKYYGLKISKRTFRVFIVLASIGILSEYAQLSDLVYFGQITFKGIFIAIIAKCIGLIWAISLTQKHYRHITKIMDIQTDIL